VTLSPFTQYALLAFLVLLLLRFIIRRVPAVRDAGPEYAFYTPRMKRAALLFVAGGAVLGTVLAIGNIEQWERVTLAYSIVGGIALVMIRLAEHRQRKDG
jgi:hypothetical protein